MIVAVDVHPTTTVILVHRCRLVRGYTCLCEPALDLAQHCTDIRRLMVRAAVQRYVVVVSPRERLLNQALVPPEQRLCGAEAERQQGTWRCVCRV